MFVIRQEHLDAFAESYNETFEDRIVQHLRVKFPAQCEERLDQIRAEARERRQADRQKKAAKTESDVSSRKEWA